MTVFSYHIQQGNSHRNTSGSLFLEKQVAIHLVIIVFIVRVRLNINDISNKLGTLHQMQINPYFIHNRAQKTYAKLKVRYWVYIEFDGSFFMSKKAGKSKCLTPGGTSTANYVNCQQVSDVTGHENSISERSSFLKVMMDANLWNTSFSLKLLSVELARLWISAFLQFRI